MTETTFQLNPEAEQQAVDRVRAVRAARNGEAATTTLANLEAACASDDNLFETVLAAVEARCTLGEIVQIMENRWGTFQAPRA